MSCIPTHGHRRNHIIPQNDLNSAQGAGPARAGPPEGTEGTRPFAQAPTEAKALPALTYTMHVGARPRTGLFVVAAFACHLSMQQLCVMVRLSGKVLFCLNDPHDMGSFHIVAFYGTPGPSNHGDMQVTGSSARRSYFARTRTASTQDAMERCFRNLVDKVDAQRPIARGPRQAAKWGRPGAANRAWLFSSQNSLRSTFELPYMTGRAVAAELLAAAKARPSQLVS